MITELCCGNLREVIAPENKLLTPFRVGEIITQILDGVAYMHRMGIAHRGYISLSLSIYLQSEILIDKLKMF
jgi:serine/threonine protein kinase